jgi:hypothetical protein
MAVSAVRSTIIPRVQLLDRIRVPWTPYGLTFSRDGARLAIGGGTWYGNGGIIVRALVGRTDMKLNWGELRDDPILFPERWRAAVEIYTNNWTKFDSGGMGIPAVSSVYFSDDGRYLAASMWHARWEYAPTAVFGVGAAALTVEAVIEGQEEWQVCHTGVLLHRGQVVVRRHAMFSPNGSGPAIDPVPIVPSCTHGSNDHLTHSRIVVRRGVALTSGTAFAASDRTRHRLISRALDGTDAEQIEVGDTRGVSAISACREEDRFLTGGFDGEIDLWQWDSGWHSTRLRRATTQHEGILELVTARSGQLIAVTGAGLLLVGSPDGEFAEWKIPVPGRPRSLAAHPNEDVVAVGLKGGGWVSPESDVAFVRLD